MQEQKTARPAARLRDERGQSLVEYALIIAMVSLGAVVSLSFLSGKINTLLSKTGNSLNSVQVAEGAGSGSGSGGGSAPVITISQQPSNPTQATSATFQFTSSPAGTSYLCQVSGGPAAASCNPNTNITYNGLSTGSHTFSVTPTPAGTSGTYTWTISSSPVITITQQPSNPTTSTTAVFSFSSNPAATSYVCQVVPGPAAAACNPNTAITYSGLAIGSHTFTVTPTPAGTNGTFTWTISGQPPTAGSVTITGQENPSGSGPSSTINDSDFLTASASGWNANGSAIQTYTFVWQVGDDTTATCGGGNNQPCNVQSGCVGEEGAALTWTTFASPPAQAGSSNQVTTATWGANGNKPDGDRCYRAIVTATSAAGSSAPLTSTSYLVQAR